MIIWTVSAVFTLLVLSANVCFVLVYNRNKDVGAAVTVLVLKRRLWSFIKSSSLPQYSH